jgi:hypothetical protein
VVHWRYPIDAAVQRRPLHVASAALQLRVLCCNSVRCVATAQRCVATAGAALQQRVLRCNSGCCTVATARLGEDRLRFSPTLSKQDNARRLHLVDIFLDTPLVR